MTRFGGIGDRIRERLRVLGFWKNGRPDVAKFCAERRYRPQYVYAWLRDRVPGPDNLNRLSEDLGVSGPWIMFGDQVGQSVAQGVVPMLAAAHGRGRAAAPRGRPRREPAAAEEEIGRPGPPRDLEEPTAKVRIIDFGRLREVTDKLVLLEAELDGILQAFPDLYFLLDADGTILDFKVGRGSGFPLMPDALLGRTVEDALPGGVGLSLHAAALDAIQTGTLAAREFSLEGRDDRRTYEARFVSLEDIPLREKKALAIVRDITERKRAEEATRALVEVDKLLTQTVDLDRVLRLLVEKAAELLPAPAACVFLSEEADGGVVHTVQQSHGLPPEIQGKIRRTEGEGVVGKAMHERRPIWSADVLADPGIRLSQEVRQWNLEHGIPRAILAVPLVLGDTVIGGLAVYRPAGAAYKPAEVELLAALASQAVIAIENARLFRQEHERRQQVEAVRAVSAEITRELDLTRLLGLVHRRAAELVRAASGVVYLWDEGASVLVPKAWHGYGDWLKDVRLRPGEAIAGTVAQRREGLIVNDYRNSPYADPLTLEHTEHTAAMAEPLLYRGRVLGVITVGALESRGPFTEQDRETLTLFATQAAIAIENARLYQEERKRSRDLTGLIRAARAIASSADLAQILESVVQSAVELTGASVAAMHLLEEGGWLVRAASAGALMEESEGQAPLGRMRIGEGGAGAVAASGQPLWIADLASDPRNRIPEFNARHGMRWYLGMPILGRRGVLGVLGIKGSQVGGETEAQRDLLESLAAVAAIAIERVRLSKS